MEDYRVRRSLGEHVLRCSVLIAALFIMSLGIALSTKADLGVSPISCTPYVLSLAFPLTMGTVTILMHLSFVAVQAALLKRQFRPAHLLQIPIVFIFGLPRSGGAVCSLAQRIDQLSGLWPGILGKGSSAPQGR